MNVYIVRRSDNKVDYDEYDSVVIVAEDEQEALREAFGFHSYFGEEGVMVKEVDLKSKGVIHYSFCTG